MSGVELTRLVRDETSLKDIPVILITGRSDATGAVDGFGAGADDVVAKPFHFEVLLARIAQRLAKARAVRELRHDNAVLDARVVTRAIELGETRAALEASEAERRRLAAIVSKLAAGRDNRRFAAPARRYRAQSPDWRARTRPCCRNRDAPRRP